MTKEEIFIEKPIDMFQLPQRSSTSFKGSSHVLGSVAMLMSPPHQFHSVLFFHCCVVFSFLFGFLVSFHSIFLFAGVRVGFNMFEI